MNDYVEPRRLKLPSDWPSEGRIEFDRLSLEYVPGEPVLKAVSFQVTWLTADVAGTGRCRVGGVGFRLAFALSPFSPTLKSHGNKLLS